MVVYEYNNNYVNAAITEDIARTISMLLSIRHYDHNNDRAITIEHDGLI